MAQNEKQDSRKKLSRMKKHIWLAPCGYSPDEKEKIYNSIKKSIPESKSINIDTLSNEVWSCVGWLQDKINLLSNNPDEADKQEFGAKDFTDLEKKHQKYSDLLLSIDAYTLNDLKSEYQNTYPNEDLKLDMDQNGFISGPHCEGSIAEAIAHTIEVNKLLIRLLSPLKNRDIKHAPKDEVLLNAISTLSNVYIGVTGSKISRGGILLNFIRAALEPLYVGSKCIAPSDASINSHLARIMAKTEKIIN